MNQSSEILTCKIAVLIKKFGLRTMTMDEICKNIGISKTKLAFLFKNREQLLSICMDHLNDELNTKLSIILLNSDDIIKKLDCIMQITFEHLSDYHSMFYYDLRKNSKLQAKFQDYITDYKLKILSPLINHAIENGYFRDGSDTVKAVNSYLDFIKIFFINFKDEIDEFEYYRDKFFIEYTSEISNSYVKF